jgi:hypothetical protein
MFIMRSGKRVLIRRGEPQGRAHGGVDDRGGHLGLLGMTAESSNASFLQCGGACAWHSSRGCGRRRDRGPVIDLLSGLSGLAIGYTLNLWQRPRREKFSRQPT